MAEDSFSMENKSVLERDAEEPLFSFSLTHKFIMACSEAKNDLQPSAFPYPHSSYNLVTSLRGGLYSSINLIASKHNFVPVRVGVH